MQSEPVKQKNKILIVDDEAFNLDILETTLEEAGYEVVRAIDGKSALQMLSGIDKLDAIILDRMMPGLDGISVLKTLKTNSKYHHIPVIMQTADGHHQQMMEGIQAGAYYYLIKPFNEEVLLSIVKAAIRDARKLKKISNDVSKFQNIIGILEETRFRFRTFDEAEKIADFVSFFCPNPEKVRVGLYELMVNAIEYGNLGVPYEKKYQLMAENKWQEEVQRLVSLPENADKFATLAFVTRPQEITIYIKDQGKGFRWRDYMDFDPMRMTEPHGRGIAMSNAICFSSLEYEDNGTQAVCHIARNDFS